MQDDRREPTHDELLAMAYVDGELSTEERRDFEARLADDAALGREVAELRGLELLARRMAPPEPADHEWARVRASASHRIGSRVGFLGLGGGALALVALALWAIFTSDEALGLKLAIAALVVGVASLFLVTLRARLAQLPFDPYTKVQR